MEVTQDKSQASSLSTLTEILKVMSTEKMTVAELIQLLPELTELQKVQAPNIKASLDALRENCSYEANTVNSLRQQEIDMLQKRADEATDKKEKDYWTSQARESIGKAIDETVEISDKQKRMWIYVLMAVGGFSFALFKVIKR